MEIMPQKMQLQYKISVENVQWLRKAAFKTADTLTLLIYVLELYLCVQEWLSAWFLRTPRSSLGEGLQILM